MEELKYHYKYPHPAVTTDCVVFGYEEEGSLKVLLIKRKHEPDKGKWAFPGGFLNMDETAEYGALRELKEETGLTNADIRQFYTFTNPKRDSRERVISIAFYALVKIQDVKGGDDASMASWFGLDVIPELAFDHNLMFKMALRALRCQACVEPVGMNLLPEKFSIEEFSRLYTAILGDVPVNYLLSLGLIKSVNGEYGQLYKFGKSKFMPF